MVTGRARLGFGILVCVPQFHHDIRIAEKTAFVDVLSGGRVEVGTGRSSTWPELGGFGAPPEDTKKALDEYVRVLPQMCTQERFEYQGGYISFPERTILPKPYQKPHPPMWVAVSSVGTEIDAGTRGLGMLGISFGSPAEQEAKVANYRAAAPPSRHRLRTGGRRVGAAVGLRLHRRKHPAHALS